MPFFADLIGTKYDRPLRQIIEAHAHLWEHRQHPHFTLHDEAHAVSITDKLNNWLGGVPKSHLSVLDTFLLRSAIYLHDIGMQCPCDPFLRRIAKVQGNAPFGHDDLEQIRKTHHKLSRRMVEDLPANPRECSWGYVDPTGIAQEIYAIALLCEGHAIPELKDIAPEINAEYVNLPQRTNLSRLLYLLRIGDAMDLEARRVNSEYVIHHYESLKTEDKYHTWKHWFVANIEVNGGIITFNYVVPCEYTNLRPDIETCVEAPLQNGLREMGPQLVQWGDWLPLVDRKWLETDCDLHTDCPFDNDVWTFFNDQALIHERGERQFQDSQGTREVHARIMPDNQTSTLLIDDAKRVFVSPKCVKSPEDTKETPVDLVARCRSILSKGNRPLILAPYGMGKSYFVRRFLWDAVRTPGNRDKEAFIIPLRDLYYVQGKTSDFLEALLHVLYSEKRQSSEREDFRARWRDGRLLLLLDGLDEIPYVDAYLTFFAEMGTNDAVVTCRDGYLSKDAPKNDRVVPVYLREWNVNDFENYVRQCHGFVTSPDSLIKKVKERPTLMDLATRPLYARMIVEVGRIVEHLDDAIRDEYTLVDHFVHAAFQRKAHLSAYKDRIDAKMSCMIVIAGYFLRKGYRWGTIEELQKEACALLHTHGAEQILKFFKTEVSVNSLMQPIGDGCVTFSHEPIHDYFTVRYLEKMWEALGQNGLATYLGVQKLLPSTIRFLVQRFQDQREQLREFSNDYKDNTAIKKRILRSNCQMIHECLSLERSKSR